MKDYDPTVFIVDDDSEMCESLRWLIDPLNLTVKTYKSTQTFLNEHQTTDHGCLLLDVRMPELSGLGLQKQLLQKKIMMSIIIITGHGDVSVAVKAMKLGAIDFLTKPFNDQELLDSINKAIAIDKERFQRWTHYHAIEKHIQLLSPREKQVMCHIVDGCSNKSVASKLNIAAKTVELHRAKIMLKMEATSLPCLVKQVFFYEHLYSMTKNNM